MEKGNISNAHPARMFFTWDTLAFLPDKSRPSEHRAIRFHRWDGAVRYWVMHEHMFDWLNWLTWNTDFKLGVVTCRPEGFAEALHSRLLRHQVPIRDVLSYQPDEFARRLAHMPDVVRVFYSDPHHGLKYGSTGRFVPSLGAGFHPLS